MCDSSLVITPFITTKKFNVKLSVMRLPTLKLLSLF